MNSEQPPVTDPNKLDEAITAYLDGELAGDQLREIEQRLASDSAFRERMRSMERPWDLLDELPRTEVGQQFGATTVEMVAMSAASKIENDNWGRQLLSQWTIVCFSVLVACLVGFLLSTGVASIMGATGLVKGADDQLLADLTILEHLDKYQLVDDIEFLRAFSQLPAMKVDANSADASPSPQSLEAPEASGTTASSETPVSSETAAEKKSRIAALPPSDLKRLATKQEHFHDMTLDDRAKIRDFHQRLVSDPQAEVLVEALNNYYEWYKQLDPLQHAELGSRPASERLRHIQELREKQSVQHARDRMREDSQVIVNWLQQVALQHEEELLKSWPEFRREAQRHLTEQQREMRLMMVLWQRWQKLGGPYNPPFDEAEYIKMKTNLSPEFRQELDKHAPPIEEVQYILKSVPGKHQKLMLGTDDALATFNAVALQRFWPLVAGQVSRERLMAAFGQLPKERQEQLKHLTRDDNFRELRRMYLRNTMRNHHGSAGGKNRKRDGETDVPTPRPRRGPLDRRGGRPPRDFNGDGPRPDRPPPPPRAD